MSSIANRIISILDNARLGYNYKLLLNSHEVTLSHWKEKNSE